MTATPILLDCDPGHDDMVAIMLAAANPAIDLRAITTVAGNASLERVTHNARATCALARIGGVPIAAGADGPLIGALKVADHVHGESGLDGVELGVGDVPLHELHAVALMARVLEDSAEPVTICAVGPLTNVAILLKAHRDLVAERVREIVVMGGTLGAGNVAPLAEFNILTDPEAAAIVVESGVPVTLCPLDVTHQALATPAIFQRLRALDTPLAQNVAVLLAFFADRYRDVWGMPEPPLHDPVTVAHLIDPTLLEIVDAHVAIELHGTHTRGATACDRFGVTGQAPNARVAIGIDADRFWDLVLDAVDRLGRAG